MTIGQIADLIRDQAEILAESHTPAEAAVATALWLCYDEENEDLQSPHAVMLGIQQWADESGVEWRSGR